MSGEEPRIGVFICHCGMNIAGVVDVEEVTEYIGTLPGVVTAQHYVYMCSQPGQALIRKSIREHGLNRVIVASCSPRMHEPTFRKTIEAEGLNPFLFEMANIREQVSWAHMRAPKEATEKAKDLIRMAVARARLLEPVSKMEVKVTPSALVIGAGVAGITASIDLAQRGFEVYLVEKEPYVGGHMALLNKLYWGRKASEVYAELTKSLSHPNIHVLVNSDIDKITGYIGNFEVKITQRPRFVNESCNLCGQCEKVCPVSVPNHVNFGLDQRKAIYLPLPGCYPPRYIVDKESCNNCGECLKVCKKNAINLDEKPGEIDINVGLILVMSGFEPYKPEGEFGYGKHKDVITQLMLERILNENGPTGGRLVRPSDGKKPRSVVFILCVGSRQESSGQEEEKSNPYCSRFCCSSVLKNALLLKEQHPDIEVYVLYRDIRTFGRGHENLYRKCRERWVNFVRYRPQAPPKVLEGENGQLTVKVKDWLFKVDMEIEADLVVLVEGMVPRSDVADLQAKLNITRSPDGFFQEAHPKMNPLDTFTDGVFIGGTAQGPKDIVDTISQASGAAAKAGIFLSRGKVLIDQVTATVNESICTGCGKCANVCPYTAISLDEVEGVAKVVEVKCKGCGSCSSTCPVGAVQVRHFKDSQILAMVENVLAS
jgi:heterodisulfide reductase subunit A